MMRQMLRFEKEISIAGSYDVVVAGGGVAGIAAALAAARNGAKKVLLLEKQYVLGGLATLGLIAIYLPLCDGKGRQVSFGICEELCRLSVKHGSEFPLPQAWLQNLSAEEKRKHRFELTYNPNMFAILAEQLLRQNGVEILFGTSVLDVCVHHAKIDTLIAENKSGIFAVRATSVVDATGDADICHFAGEDTAVFKQGNILASWYYFMGDGKINLKMLGYSDTPDKYKTQEQKNTQQRRYAGLDGRELSEMVSDAHDSLLQDFLKNGDITPQRSLTAIAAIPQVRMTRRLDGVYVQDDTEAFAQYPDSIGMISDWRKPGPVYEIPFRTLYGRNIKNLITAGRCISVTDPMWDISRVIPPCAVTGEAAGTAAAMTDDFAELEVSRLQAVLQRNGVMLHL